MVKLGGGRSKWPTSERLLISLTGVNCEAPNGARFDSPGRSRLSLEINEEGLAQSGHNQRRGDKKMGDKNESVGPTPKLNEFRATDE